MALVTTVDFLTQSNSNFNVLDIKQFFFLVQSRDCTVGDKVMHLGTWASLKQLSSALAYVKPAVKRELTTVTITSLGFEFMSSEYSQPSPHLTFNALSSLACRGGGCEEERN